MFLKLLLSMSSPVKMTLLQNQTVFARVTWHDKKLLIYSFSAVLIFWASTITSVEADYGNLCRCICGTTSKGELTLIISSELGCRECSPRLCQEQFSDICKPDAKVVVHCLNRMAWLPKYCVISLICIVVVLVSLGFLKEHFPILSVYLRTEHIRVQPTLPSSSFLSRNCIFHNQQEVRSPGSFTSVGSNNSFQLDGMSASTPFLSTNAALSLRSDNVRRSRGRPAQPSGSGYVLFASAARVADAPLAATVRDASTTSSAGVGRHDTAGGTIGEATGERLLNSEVQ